MLLAKSLIKSEMARQLLIMCLSNELSVTSDRLVAAEHDHASVAIQFARCGMFLATLDHAGENLQTDEFMKVWIGLFTRSRKAKLSLEGGYMFASPSITQWWPNWEVMIDMLVAFGDVLPFLENSDLPPSSQKRVDILN